MEIYIPSSGMTKNGESITGNTYYIVKKYYIEKIWDK